MIEIVHRNDSSRVLYKSESAADLRAAILEAVAGGANLSYANLSGANLSYANLSYANLGYANLSWTSHDLIAEILRRAADDDVPRLKYAGLVLLQRDWCWSDHLALADEMLPWALAELAKWIRPDDGHPACLDVHVVRQAEPEAEPVPDAAPAS